MPSVDRRRFLQMAGGAAAAAMLQPSIARATTIAPASRTKSINDVEHIVVLMQENRSFDHYFGTMRGVRGFGDPHPALLHSGKDVWHQPAPLGAEILPFRPAEPGARDLSLTFIQDLDHSWNGTHAAFAGGRYDGWIGSKGPTTMAHLARPDMPFQYALADAFTVCDSYFCGMLGPTDTNRYYMWTGWDGNDRKGGGPVVDNDELGYDWTTYPQRLQQAGISWKVYQDIGTGLDAGGSWGYDKDPYIGNYGDNSLLYFNAYRTAKAGSPLYQAARTGTNSQAGEGFFDQLAADVRGGRLPQVSYVVAPEAYSEHPSWPVGYGAWYTARVLDALTSNTDVWAKTALFITFDENDGFFDHVVPPFPNVGSLQGDSTVSTENEFFNGVPGTAGGKGGVPGNFGLGIRVPMLVVSPWSRGGWACSEVFDHTSIIRFMEKRFGVHEPNITPWRRAVCGDLTSAFDFTGDQKAVPNLPNTDGYRPTLRLPNPIGFIPIPPLGGAVPRQEPGTRPSRTLGYRLAADYSIEGGRLRLDLRNTGSLGAVFQVRSATLPGAPLSYTVGAGHQLTPSWAVGAYDVQVHGPNGFYRRFAANAAAQPIRVGFAANDALDSVRLDFDLTGGHTGDLTAIVADAYGKTRRIRLKPAQQQSITVSSGERGGWYDLAVTVVELPDFAAQYAGRLDGAGRRTSDPQLGRPSPARASG